MNRVVGLALLGLAVLLGLWVPAVANRPFWYDEYFTLGMAKLPDLSQIRLMLETGREPHPPLHYLLQRWVLVLGGKMELSFRLISLFGLVASCTVVWFLAWRETGRHLAGILAVSILLSSYLSELAQDGRPYSLYCGLTGLTWLAWEQAKHNELSRLGLAWRFLLGLLMAALVSTHYYAVFVIGILLIIDFARLHHLPPRRWLEALVYVPSCLLTWFYLPWIQASAINVARIWQDVPHYVHRTTFHSVWLAMGQHLLPSLPAVLVGCIVATLIHQKRKWAPNQPPTGRTADFGMVVALLGYPILIFAVGWLWTGVYFARYAAPGMLGYAFAFAVVAAHLDHRLGKPVLAWAVAVSGVMVICLGPFAWWRNPNQPASDLKALLLNLPVLHEVVIANPIDFPQYSFYAPPDVRPRLIYLSDPVLMRTYPDPIPETMLFLLRNWMPLQIVPVADYLRQRREFALITRRALEPGEWLPRRLSREGWLIGSSKCVDFACVSWVSPSHGIAMSTSSSSSLTLKTKVDSNIRSTCIDLSHPSPTRR